MHTFDRIPYLLFRERCIEAEQVAVRFDQLLKVERALAGGGSTNEVVEVGERGLRHLILLVENPAGHREAEDPVLLPGIGALPVEERGISIAIFQGSNARALLGYGALHGREADVGELEGLVEPDFMRR